MAVWPSRNVVKSWARATGMGVFLGITFSTSPPIVSSPSESGVTSRSRKSLSTSFPASLFAWIAAPTATTQSGSIPASGSRPKKDSIWERTIGMRVAPPTRTIPLMSEGASFASAMVERTASRARARMSFVDSSNSFRPRRRESISPLSSTTEKSVSSVLESLSFAARLSARSFRRSEAVRAASSSLASLTAQP